MSGESVPLTVVINIPVSKSYTSKVQATTRTTESKITETTRIAEEMPTTELFIYQITEKFTN